jgi:hypothetical protein
MFRLHLTYCGKIRRWLMDEARRKARGKDSEEHVIDVDAPAGSDDSLGAESVRDGRPSTDDEVVEAIDEETPGEELKGGR